MTQPHDPLRDSTETTSDSHETMSKLARPFRVTADRKPAHANVIRRIMSAIRTLRVNNLEGSTVSDTEPEPQSSSARERSQNRRHAWIADERTRYANLWAVIRRGLSRAARGIYYRIWLLLQLMSDKLSKAPQPHRLAEDELRFNNKLGYLFRLIDVHPNIEVAPFNGKSGAKSTVASILAMFKAKWTRRLVVYWVANPGVAADSEQYAGVYNRHERKKRKWLDKLTAAMIARGIGVPTGDTRDIAELFFGNDDGSFSWDKPNDVSMDDFQSVVAPNYVETMVIAATSRVDRQFGYYAVAMHALFKAIKSFVGALVVDTGNNTIDAWTGALLDEIGQVMFVAEAPSSDRGASSLTDARTTMAQMREILTETPGNLEKLQDAILVISGTQHGDDLDAIIEDYFPDLDELDLEMIEVMTIPYDEKIRKERFYDIDELSFATEEAFLDLWIRLFQKAIIRQNGSLDPNLRGIDTYLDTPQPISAFVELQFNDSSTNHGDNGQATTPVEATTVQPSSSYDSIMSAEHALQLHR